MKTQDRQLDDIDLQCEREARALHRQGRQYNHNYPRIRQAENYNKTVFDKLFADCK